jgi:hypothetical protein
MNSPRKYSLDESKGAVCSLSSSRSAEALSETEAGARTTDVDFLSSLSERRRAAPDTIPAALRGV